MRLLLLIALVCLVVALVCTLVPTVVLGAGWAAWLTAGLIFCVLDDLFGGRLVSIGRTP